ncbi:hypothetical protein ACTWP5_30145 [Streptomyces sp. 4N509B]|uniref:hypothetical protein n=1 Tax=Streptomyces sp. 4N509B TaxID=3457413 RepID=UPI003FD6033E
MSDVTARRVRAAREALREAEQHLATIEQDQTGAAPLTAAAAAIRGALELLRMGSEPAPNMAGILKAAYPQIHAAVLRTERLLEDHAVLLCMECGEPQLPADLDDTGRCQICVAGPFTSPHADHLPDWAWSPAAEIAYGDLLPHLTGVITDKLYRLPLENLSLARARTNGNLALQAGLMALEVRDDLLEAGAVLDAVALSCPLGPYLPDSCQEGPEPPPRADELRAEAGQIAEALLTHDREHGTNATPTPDPVEERDASREQARAYMRRDWRASRSTQAPQDEPAGPPTS